MLTEIEIQHVTGLWNNGQLYGSELFSISLIDQVAFDWSDTGDARRIGVGEWPNLRIRLLVIET